MGCTEAAEFANAGSLVSASSVSACSRQPGIQVLLELVDFVAR